eukprot:GHVU01187516.1.p1 GENE.GHVU01187516.1~~GHVU01187516.1.p1  ORF type:complete len:140 (-),score=2.49 GHVU01187516.1:152-571(-)
MDGRGSEECVVRTSELKEHLLAPRQLQARGGAGGGVRVVWQPLLASNPSSLFAHPHAHTHTHTYAGTEPIQISERKNERTNLEIATNYAKRDHQHPATHIYATCRPTISTYSPPLITITNEHRSRNEHSHSLSHSTLLH